MISLRTKDEVTLAATRRLFALADTPESVGRLEEEKIAQAIYPAGFYRTKARHIRQSSQIIAKDHAGTTPNTTEELTALPGVGRKTANLVLGLGFGIEAICVDTHVHRIPNRLGWISTSTPEQTEDKLMSFLPRRYWIEANELLVSFGQTTCLPVSPWCSRCPLTEHCARVNVSRSR